MRLFGDLIIDAYILLKELAVFEMKG